MVKGKMNPPRKDDTITGNLRQSLNAVKDLVKVIKPIGLTDRAQRYLRRAAYGELVMMYYDDYDTTVPTTTRQITTNKHGVLKLLNCFDMDCETPCSFRFADDKIIESTPAKLAAQTAAKGHKRPLRTYSSSMKSVTTCKTPPKKRPVAKQKPTPTNNVDEEQKKDVEETPVTDEAQKKAADGGVVDGAGANPDDMMNVEVSEMIDEIVSNINKTEHGPAVTENAEPTSTATTQENVFSLGLEKNSKTCRRVTKGSCKYNKRKATIINTTTCAEE
ncbi:hypothetical protein C5167_048573 [Papaver somniferum]|uniref:Uncharacterized protein n=1 Tax=Papaver somniferum TaxID=3469 RepID=A0A4Y7KLQ0_PAPSO|nr:hypothetical protein C5167_048573 [Papaver somniferum]